MGRKKENFSLSQPYGWQVTGATIVATNAAQLLLIYLNKTPLCITKRNQEHPLVYYETPH